MKYSAQVDENCKEMEEDKVEGHHEEGYEQTENRDARKENGHDQQSQKSLTRSEKTEVSVRTVRVDVKVSEKGGFEEVHTLKLNKFYNQAALAAQTQPQIDANILMGSQR